MNTTTKALAVVFAVCVLTVLSGCDSKGKLGPLKRTALVGMVKQGAEERLWVLYKQEETRRYTTQARYHFELRGYDTSTADHVWTKRLLTVPYNDGGYNAEGRILGQEGEHVWLFLHNQPVAVTSAHSEWSPIARALFYSTRS